MGTESECLWKVLWTIGNEHLASVVAARGEADAWRQAERMGHGSDPAVGSVRLERCRIIGPARPLQVRLWGDLVLDAGTVVRVPHVDRCVRVVLAPGVPLLDQVLEWMRRRPRPVAGWRPDPALEARAVGLLVFRWGSYFSAIADPGLPRWEYAGRSSRGYFSDQEQARMNIEASANIEALSRLNVEDGPDWWHIVRGALLLGGWGTRSPGMAYSGVHGGLGISLDGSDGGPEPYEAWL